MKQSMDQEIPTYLPVQPHFSFVSVFRESIQFCRIYNLPFLAISVCLNENPNDPSSLVNLKTGVVNIFHKNDISLVLSGTPHRYTYKSEFEHLVIHFQLELFPGTGVFPEDGSCFVINSLKLRRECEEIFQISDPIRRLVSCQKFALKICLMHWPQNYDLDLEAKRFFEPVMHYIRKHVSAETQIEELAEMLGCSKVLFSRRFRTVFGEPLKKYLQKELFYRATLLLVDHQMNIKEVATMLGFSSEFYFSKFFKRCSGISPSEYRQRAHLMLSVKK